jgi:hypothetical protein
MGADDPIRVKVIVTDAGPLITLAAADSLDYLLLPGLPVYIPDAVVYEATKDVEALGARSILEWRDRHRSAVVTVTTEVFMHHVQDLERAPGRRTRDLGERAAIEAIHDAIDIAPDERALLLTEDDRVLRQVLVTQPELSDRIIPLTTRDYLVELETAGRINSADEVYRAAERAGRVSSQRRTLTDQVETRRGAVRPALARGEES